MLNLIFRDEMVQGKGVDPGFFERRPEEIAEGFKPHAFFRPIRAGHVIVLTIHRPYRFVNIFS